MAFWDFFRARCPSCKRRGLQAFGDLSIREGAREGLRVTPAFSWHHCPNCDAKFKKPIRGNEFLVATEAEWQQHVHGQ